MYITKESAAGRKFAKSVAFRHNIAYEALCTKLYSYVLKTGCKGEDKDRRNHCDEALGNAGHSLFKVCELTDSYRTHYKAYHETVEVIIDEDEHTKDEGSKLFAYSGLDVSLCPFTKGARAACFVDKSDDYTKLNKEDKDAYRTGNSAYKACADGST